MSKRILSLVLALVMVLGTFGTVFAAEPTEVVLDSKVQWLVEQGLLQGDGSGNLDLDKAITRDVLARIVAVALEDEKSADSLKALPSGFADMTPAHWANGYASYANAKGYMVGNEKTEFMPAAVVNYDQALVVLTKIALGGDLTEAEKANSLTWYAPYVAKANELGVTEGVSILNVGAPAVKEDIVKMLYNVLNNKDFGNYNVLKVVVLENDRIARLGENEVTVEVMKEVQRANFVDASREDLKGEQYTYELPAKFNAEDLLGKVVDLSVNKDGKVVEVKEDTTFEVKTGKVSDITASRLTVDKKEYIVNLDERYNKEDERVYRTYLNDKDVKYTDFAKNNEEVEYARVTVKAGKVVFVDAYNFDDIMPVKDIKVVREKDTIVSYDDVRDGNVIETTVSNARVILVNGKTFTRGTLENVKVDNVIHTYKVGTATKYVVLQDAALEGKLDKITEDKDGEYVVVDGKEYTIPVVSPKQAVYEFKSNDKFYTLDAKTAYRELNTFKGEEVRVLLGLDGKVQYVGSKVEFGEYVGVATRIVGREMRVLNSENKLNDYEANLDTKVVVGNKTTGHQGLNGIERNSLVYINADDKTLVKVADLDKQVAVTKLTERDVNNFRITDDSVVYVVNTKDEVEVRKIADVVKAYDKLSVTDQNKVKVSLIDEKEFNDISVRGYKFNRATNVHTMVLYNLNIKPAEKDAIYGKLIRYDNRRVGSSDITVELANGARRTFVLDRLVDEDNINFEKEVIYKIVESKEKEDLALEVTKVVNYVTKQVKSVENYEYTFTDGTKAFETRNTDIFGRKPVKDSKISYVLDATYTEDMVLIVNPGYGIVDNTTSGVVTYISGDSLTIEVDGKVYTVNDSTIVKYNSRTLAIGKTDVAAIIGTGLAIDENDKVKIDGNVITIVESVVLTAAAGTDASGFTTTHATILGKTVATVATTDQGNLTAALTAYNALTPEAKALLADEKALLDSLQVKINQLVAAQATSDANGFKTTYATELAKTLATVEDGDNIAAATSAYASLSPEAKALLTAEIALLEKLEAREDAIAAVTTARTTATRAAMKAALEDADLGLDLTAFNALLGAQQNLVLDAMLGLTTTYTNAASVQADLNAQL